MPGAVKNQPASSGFPGAVLKIRLRLKKSGVFRQFLRWKNISLTKPLIFTRMYYLYQKKIGEIKWVQLVLFF